MSEVKLVPARMLLDKETIGAINFHCGDGNTCGEYCDGVLWIGTVTDDEGAEVYGLHLQTAEYPEEGSTTLVEFDEPVSDFDAQRLRADTAEAELGKVKRTAIIEILALNSTLNNQAKELSAAEQRIAELTELLREVSESLWQEDDSGDLFERIDAALNPKPEAGSHDRISD